MKDGQSAVLHLPVNPPTGWGDDELTKKALSKYIEEPPACYCCGGGYGFSSDGDARRLGAVEIVVPYKPTTTRVELFHVECLALYIWELSSEVENAKAALDIAQNKLNLTVRAYNTVCGALLDKNGKEIRSAEMGLHAAAPQDGGDGDSGDQDHGSS